METKVKKQNPQDFKKKRGSPSRGSLHEILQRGAGSSGEHSRGAGATSEPAVEVSAKGRVEPAVTCLRYHQRPPSRDLAVLAYRSRELAVLAHLKSERG
jgi:hypothetical protein